MMYARVTTGGSLQPGKLDELIRVYETLTPVVKDLKGFISAQLLVDRTANTGMTVTLYETLADLEAGTPVFRQVLADPRVAALMASPPVVAVYEVAV
jgi:heme-degrading monooxygenase HmoA